SSLSNFLQQVTDLGAIATLTLQPWGGLESVQESDCEDLSRICAFYEAHGIGGIFLRFAHEMNGNWYPWGQRPNLYKRKFQIFSAIVHANTGRTAMLWAPNYGVGYPFGQLVPAPMSDDFHSLDTN